METKEKLLQRLSNEKSLSDFKFNCEICGTECIRTVKSLRNSIKSGNGFFCSQQCYATSKRGGISKFSTYCCAACGVATIRQTSEVKDEARVFCSHSCAAKFNNSKRKLTEDTKSKISRSLKSKDNPTRPAKLHNCICLNCGVEFISKFKKTKSCSAECLNALRKRNKKLSKSKESKRNPYCFVKFESCKECLSIFTVTKRRSIKKFCSDECRKASASRKMSERLSKAENRLNLGRGKMSYMERTFHEWLVLHNVPFEMEVRFKNYDTNRYYFVDFYFNHLNLVIELDGTHHLKTAEEDSMRDAYMKEYYGIDVLRISHKEYTKKTKIDIVKRLLEIK